jgi:hypothetical protein
MPPSGVEVSVDLRSTIRLTGVVLLQLNTGVSITFISSPNVDIYPLLNPKYDKK